MLIGEAFMEEDCYFGCAVKLMELGPVTGDVEKPRSLADLCPQKAVAQCRVAS